MTTFWEVTLYDGRVTDHRTPDSVNFDVIQEMKPSVLLQTMSDAGYEFVTCIQNYSATVYRSSIGHPDGYQHECIYVFQSRDIHY